MTAILERLILASRRRRSVAGLVYVGGAKATGTNADYAVSLTSLSGGIASAAAANDLVIVVAAAGTKSDIAIGVTTTGYTELAELWVDDFYDTNVSVNWKLMGGTPDTSVTVTASNSSARGAACVVHVWRGADQTTPIDVTTTTATGNGDPIDSPSITPITTGAVVLSVGAVTVNDIDETVTSPSGYTNVVVSSKNGDPGVTAVCASKPWSSGAENPGNWDNFVPGADNLYSWCAASIAIRPAA